MSLVTDVYNKLHSRDELVFCPSCRRILYIPEDLPPQTAISAPKASPRRTRTAAAEKAEPPPNPGSPSSSGPPAAGRAVRPPRARASAPPSMRTATPWTSRS